MEKTKLEREARELAAAIVDKACEYLQDQGYENIDAESSTVLLSALTQTTVRTAAKIMPPDAFLAGFLKCLSQHYEGIETHEMNQRERDAVLAAQINGPTFDC